MNERRPTLLWLLAMALGSTAPVAHADDETAALRGQLQQIEALTQEFEARLRALEATRASSDSPRTGAAPAPAAVSSPAAVVPPAGAVPKQAWHQLHEGLTAGEVTALLGPATRVFELSGRTVWYYSYPAAGAGSVFFTSAGRISSVQRP